MPGVQALSSLTLTPGHTRRGHVPQQHGAQRRVTALVRWGSGGQNAGEGGRDRQGPA